MAQRGNEILSAKAVEGWLKAPGNPGQKLADGGGLYLTRLPSGGGTWQVRYSFAGTVKTFSVGTYPETSLAAAREARRAVRGQVDKGLDPVLERQLRKAEGAAANEQTFEKVAREWLAKEAVSWSEVHLKKSQRALERDVFPALGKLPTARITTPMVANMIDKVQKRGGGRRETAQRILQHVRSVFSYALAKGYRADDINPADRVGEILEAAPEVKHHPALLTFPELGDVLRRAEVANTSPAVRLCHRLIAFGAVRVSNAVAARWDQFDLGSTPAVWRIPRADMKVSKGRAHDHVVILPEQIADALRRWRGAQPSEWLFPGNQGRSHISRESVEKMLRVTLGLDGKHSPHGWRSAFSTRAQEDGEFDKELVDLSLDHVHASDVARAYDRGQRLDKRVALARWWGDALAQAERGADVVRP
jgi:integrase